MNRPSVLVQQLLRRPQRLLAWLALGLLVLAQLIQIPFALAAANDDLASATDISTELNTTAIYSDVLTSIAGFTRDAAELNGLGACGGYPNSPANTYSGWYTFTPAQAGWVTIDTRGSNYDTVIEVWRGSVAQTNSVACNDDAIAGPRTSEVTLPVLAGSSYLVVVRRNGSTALPGSPTQDFQAVFSPDRVVFVDQTNGSDGNTGSAALPLRTIAKAESLLPAAGGTIDIVDPGTYNEAVTLDVPTELLGSGGAVDIAHVTLAASPVSATSVQAASVLVQASAKAQQGVDMAASAGTVTLANGTFTETVTISKDLTLQAQNEAQATIKPTSGASVQLTGGSATVTGLNLTGAKGVLISGGSGHKLQRNNLTGNSSGIGVDNQTASQVDATSSWWGSPAGPQGAGTDASGDVLFRPWCDTAIPTCTNLVGAATKLQFSTSPGSTRANAAFAAQPVVKAVDDLGTLDTSFAGSVTLAIKSSTGTASATLGGTTTVSAVAGIAIFSGLDIDYVGKDYKLSASATGLAGADSSAFNITADRLIVTSSPADPTAAGAPLAITVAARDGAGHTDTTFGGSIGLAIQTNPTGDTLHGSASKSAIAGIASFGGANEAAIFKAGVGYTLRASSGTLATADSAAFDVTGQPANTLVFSASPSNATAGAAFATQPSVSVQDAYGNTDTSFTGAVTVAITSGTGATGATLAGTTTVNAVAGVADFSGLNIVKAGTGYKLTASATSLSSGDSDAFNIAADVATELVVSASPGNTRSGVAFATQPAITARDQYGNTASGFTGAVTLAIKTGTVGATLAGTTTVNAAAGVATFAGLSIDKLGTGYVLTASASGLTSADTSSFDITPSGLAFTLEPVDTPAGQALVVKVAAQDIAGGTDTSFTGAVTLSLKNAGRGGATLFGSTTVNAVAGVADFTGKGLNIQKVGAGYVLSASASGLAVADSAAFDILPAAATKLVFTLAPASTPADANFTLAIEAQDSFGNIDTSYAGTVSLSLKPNPGGGALGGSTSANIANGFVSFGPASNLAIDRVGQSYVLHAVSGALSGESQPFNVTANRLVFFAAPAGGQVGHALAPQPVVRAVDSFGGVDTTFAGMIGLAIKPGTGANGAALRGTAARAASAGVASFGSISIDRVGSGYQLSASATGLAPATSAAFDVGQSIAYVPTALQPPQPDLVGSFALSAAKVTPFEPLLITVTVTNTGEVPASQFWVDFYINPQSPPTGTNQPWDKRCGSTRCKYGLAWYVPQTLAPGQSVTLTSTRDSYVRANTDWPGYFVTRKLDLYLYVDSWNPGIGYGAVLERHEDNNRAELHTGAAGKAPWDASSPAVPAALPARPAHPAIAR